MPPKNAHPSLILILLSAFLFCAGCTESSLERLEARMMTNITNPKDEQLVRSYVQYLWEHNYDSIERELDPRLRTDDLREKLNAMSQLLPTQEPKSVKVVGYRVVHHPDSSKTIAITLEYEFPSEWLLAELERSEDGDASTVTGFRIFPIAESVEKHNRFNIEHKSTGQYGVLLLALAALMVSIYGFISALRTPIGKKKWLWAIICLFGVGRVVVNWTTGAVGLTPLWVGFPPAGAFMVPLYSPWIVYAALPVGTMVFLIRRPRLSKPDSSISETPAPELSIRGSR